MPESRPERTRQILNEIEATFGMVPNFFKVQADVDPELLELTWNREKRIMLSEGTLDRKTKELLAIAVSLANHCHYCSLTHEEMATMVGVTEQEIIEAKQVIELIISFNSIASSLRIPYDIFPNKESK